MWLLIIFVSMKRWFPFIILMSVFILSHSDLFAQGCSMCSATSKNASDEDNSVGEQLNTGILYLMAIPYILIFIFFRKKIIAFFRELGGMYGKK